jgi:hypothetical protein
MTITESGLKSNSFNKSWIVDPFSILISLILTDLEIFTLIINEIDTHIKNGLIKLLSKNISSWGSQARTTAIASKAIDIYYLKGSNPFPSADILFISKKIITY